MKNIEATNTIREDWNQDSDGYYDKEYKNTDTLERLKRDPTKAFPAQVWENLHGYFPDLKGVRVCVPSSGDNLAAFAFHLLGARVTSCDLSPRQIENAKRVADTQGWKLDFRVCDSMELTGVADGEYDLVYTSNGVHIWISDLSMMYRNINRVLKPGGKYLFFETHPFIRPFDDKTNQLRIRKLYGDTSNFEWRVQDFVNALIESGFTLGRMDELYCQKDNIGCSWWRQEEWDQQSDWGQNPYAALPQWLALCAEKR